MEIKNLTTQLFQSIDVNTYYSFLDEFEYEDLEIRNIFEAAFVRAFDLKVSTTEYYHPREYNFIGDLMFFDLEIDDEFYKELKSYFENLDDKFYNWLKYTWGTRDGYFSFMPYGEEKEWFIENIQNHNGDAWSLLLDYYMSHERDVEYEMAQEDFYDLCCEVLTRICDEDEMED